MGYNPLNKKDFEDKFRINRVICSNSLSPNTISRAENLQNNKSVAIKEIRKEKLSKSYLHEFAKNEIAIHHSLSKLSNNIVNVIDYFEDETTYTIAMEYCEEPNYFEEILENKYNPITNERTLKAYALDILNGLNDIHKNNIIHCDIKPENFLLFKNNLDLTNGDDYQEDSFSADSFDATENIKITDFGLSHIIPLGSSKTLMKFKSGSFYYMAPEIKNDCYIDQSVDLWSFGISLYQMAVAYFPTSIKQYRYGSGPIPFRIQDWKFFDFPQLKNLIEGCLEINPEKRFTIKDALNHDWFES